MGDLQIFFAFGDFTDFLLMSKTWSDSYIRILTIFS